MFLWKPEGWPAKPRIFGSYGGARKAAKNVWLERGFSAGMLFGRVVHGHGTGAMKEAVREELRHSPFIKRWETGGEKEGGDGVSVVFFDHAWFNRVNRRLAPVYVSVFE